jgi:hypothetical protein
MLAVKLEELLHIVGPKIHKLDTTMREAIPASERLMVTLRFLATGTFSYYLINHAIVILYRYNLNVCEKNIS